MRDLHPEVLKEMVSRSGKMFNGKIDKLERERPGGIGGLH